MSSLSIPPRRGSPLRAHLPSVSATSALDEVRFELDSLTSAIDALRASTPSAASLLVRVERARAAAEAASSATERIAVESAASVARAEAAAIDAAESASRRWRQREDEWRGIVVALRARQMDQVRQEESAPAPAAAPPPVAVASSAALAASLSMAASLRAERDAAVAARAKLAEENADLVNAIDAAETARTAAEEAVNDALNRERAAREREDAALEEAAAATATRHALSDRADALAAELETTREAVRAERALGARITEAARRVRAELGAADGGRAALSAAAARSVSYLNAAANAIADPAAQAPSLKSLLVRTREAALAALSPGRALTAARAGSIPDEEPESLALATPDALREAVERFINLVAQRNDALVARAETASRAEETLRLEATSEIRRLRGMLATLGHTPADGGITRAPASSDYSAPLGASILDGEFASAAARVDSTRTASSSALPPVRAQSTTATLLPASLHAVAGVGTDAGANARAADAVDAPLAAQLIQAEFRIRELRIALHGAETRAAAAERAAEAAATRAATAAMASNRVDDADESFTEAADDLDGSFYTARGPLSPPAFATPARPGMRTAVGVTTARRPRAAAAATAHAPQTADVPPLISPADVAAFVAHVRSEEREAVLADVNAAAAAAVARAAGAPGAGSGAAVALEALAAASAAATAAERDARRLRAQLQEVATAWESARAELSEATARARSETAAAEAERAAARTLADQAAALAYVSGTERDSALAQAANASAAADAAERAAADARTEASAARANCAEIEERVSARVAAAVASATDAEAARGLVACAAAVAAADAAGASRAEAAGAAALARALDSARADAARELEAALARAGASAAERAAAALATGAASVRDAAAARAAAAAADAAAARSERDSALERIEALNQSLAAERASAAASAAAAREAAVRAAEDAAAALARARADGAALCDAVKSHAEQDVATAYSAAHAAAIEASAREAAAADEVARATAAAAAAVEAARVTARKEIARRRALAARLSDIQGNIRVHVRLRPRAKDAASAATAAEHDDDGDDEAALLRRAASGDTGYYEALTGEKLGGSSGASAAAHAILSPQRGAGARTIDAPPVVIANGDGSVLVRGGGTSLAEFDFDQVHETGSPQASVFDFVRPALDALLRTGAPTTICAYGQTGSGKTWTIEGVPKAPGVAARAIAHLFSGFRARGRATPELTISLLEIYNEHVCDLLDGVTDHDIGNFVAAVGTDMPPAHVRPRPAAPHSADEKYLELKGGASGRVAVPGATELRVHSLRAALGVLRAGAARRHTGAHALNAASSRSHLVIRIALPHEAATDSASPPPMLTIVDLAGSERVRRTGAAGERMNEATHINSSLSALGNVIAALRTRSPHVPFRDSKLTFLLRDVLQGPARVVLIACVSTDEADVAETLHTLQFAQRCRATALNLTAAATVSADVDVHADATTRARATLPIIVPVASQPVAQSHAQVKANLVRGGGGALVRRSEQPRRSVSVAPSPRGGVVLAKPAAPKLHVEPPPPPTGSRVVEDVDAESTSNSDTRGPVNALEFERARTPPRPTSPARYSAHSAPEPEPAYKPSSKLSASIAAAAAKHF